MFAAISDHRRSEIIYRRAAQNLTQLYSRAQVLPLDKWWRFLRVGGSQENVRVGRQGDKNGSWNSRPFQKKKKKRVRFGHPFHSTREMTSLHSIIP